MENKLRNLADMLEGDFERVLNQWLAAQLQEGVQRRDLFTAEEARAQARRLLSEFVRDVREAAATDRLDLGDEVWAPLKQVLTAISLERVERGTTPGEMGVFMNALKAPILDLVKERFAHDLETLIEEVWIANRILDQLALFIAEVFQKQRDEVIERQQQEMMELSTPVVQLWSGIVALPLIGTLDSLRAQDVMENLLEAIMRREAEVAIIDITGVPTVDTQVAQHLLRTAAAVRLMGAECVISGISPKIAQTIVQLGLDLSVVVTRADLQSALVYAFKRVGVVVAEKRNG
jgi:rsbT co-antagonist protein RsbR